MARTSIDIFLNDTQLSINEPSDANAMLFSPGVATSASGSVNLAFNIPILFTSVEDAVSIGVNADYDTTNNVMLYFNISEFFQKAGAGSRLWVCIWDVATYATASAYLESTAFTTAVRDTTATLFDNRPRIIMVAEPGGLAAPASGLRPDTTTAAVAFQTAIDNLFAESIRTVGILDAGRIGPLAGLPDASAYNARNVALQITTSTPDKGASVGNAGGIAASIGLARSIGAGMLPAAMPQGYFLDANYSNVRNESVATMEDLGSKQYLFVKRSPQQSGVRYNDDATLNLSTNALSQISTVRVGNSICDVLEAYLVRYMNENIPVVTENGDLLPAWKATVIDSFYAQYLVPRINRGDASAIDVDIQAKNGNLVTSRAIVAQVGIVPNGTLREVEGYVSFVVSLNQ